MAKSRAYRLKRGEAPAGGIRRIASGCAERAAEQLKRAAGEDFASSIHVARKELKKLRGVLNLVRSELGSDLYRAENERYRGAAALLAQDRDAEVRVETLAALRERPGEALPADLAAAWQDALARERDEIARQAASGAGRARIEAARTAIGEGRAEIASWPLRSDSWGLFEADLLLTYRRGRRAMERARADPTTENLHEWRKWAKHLWYQLRILRAAWSPLLAETADQAHLLTELLGDHHDLALLAEDLGTRDLPGDGAAAERAIERRQEELAESAFDLGARLFAEKPKAFVRRMAAYWTAWRKS
ncbi:MAG TPA: CHAD domain-containing protein [Solirubrobacterales bacterium]|nr:CHAD domain-containing protein [Solirubrobacterales bacterium]